MGGGFVRVVFWCTRGWQHENSLGTTAIIELHLEKINCELRDIRKMVTHSAKKKTFLFKPIVHKARKVAILKAINTTFTLVKNEKNNLILHYLAIIFVTN